MPSDTANVQISADEQVTINIRPKERYTIMFNRIGSITPRQSDSIDGDLAYTRSTKQELFFLEIARSLMDSETNTFRIHMSAYSTTDKARIKLGANKLIKRNLLVRLKREYYMINPWFFVPLVKHQSDILSQWYMSLHK